jgi:molecular chaperone GrpE
VQHEEKENRTHSGKEGNFQENDRDFVNESADENGEQADELTASLKNEVAEQRDKYLRLAADFDNYRRRVARERVDLLQTAGKDLNVSLLDILDDVDRASDQMEKTDDAEIIKEGFLLIFNKLKNQLQSRGVKEMNSLHQDFDPQLHDAVAEVPAPSEDLKGKVLDNIQKGYYLNDKLIRHAKVVVGK